MPQPLSTLRRLVYLVLVSGFSVGCDQVTKRIATQTLQHRGSISYLGDLFRLQYAENQGAFLSLGANLPDRARFWVLTVSVGLLLLGIVVYVMMSRTLDALHVSGYACIIGGGGSNWVDRALRDGSVIDFMNMGIGSLRTGVFNVADVAIFVGIGLLLLGGWKRDKAARDEKSAPAAP